MIHNIFGDNKMKKSLLALAVLSSFASAAFAQSNVTIYGILDVAVVDSTNQGGKSNTYLGNGNLSGSRLGFTGTEDLGGGTKAVWVLENGMNVATGAQSSSTSLFNRSAYVGLTDRNLGSLLLGRQYTPYYLYVGGISSTTTIISGATGAHPGDLDDLDVSLRNNNAVTYSSPLFSGAQVSAMYALGGIAGNFTAGETVSAAFKYNISAWNFAVGYQRLDSGTPSGSYSTASSAGFVGGAGINGGYSSADNVEMIAAGLRYNADHYMVGLSCSNVDYNPGAGSLFKETEKLDSFGIFGTYNPTTAITLGAGYSHTAANSANRISDAAKYDQLSLAQTYTMSKRTTLYLLEGYQRASGQKLNSIGAIVDAVASVGDSQNGTPSSGGSQTVLMAGIRHSF
jgi:predicted porin